MNLVAHNDKPIGTSERFMMIERLMQLRKEAMSLSEWHRIESEGCKREGNSEKSIKHMRESCILFGLQEGYRDAARIVGGMNVQSDHTS